MQKFEIRKCDFRTLVKALYNGETFDVFANRLWNDRYSKNSLCECDGNYVFLDEALKDFLLDIGVDSWRFATERTHRYDRNVERLDYIIIYYNKAKYKVKAMQIENRHGNNLPYEIVVDFGTLEKVIKYKKLNLWI